MNIRIIKCRSDSLYIHFGNVEKNGKVQLDVFLQSFRKRKETLQQIKSEEIIVSNEFIFKISDLSPDTLYKLIFNYKINEQKYANSILAKTESEEIRNSFENIQVKENGYNSKIYSDCYSFNNRTDSGGKFSNKENNFIGSNYNNKIASYEINKEEENKFLKTNESDNKSKLNLGLSQSELILQNLTNKNRLSTFLYDKSKKEEIKKEILKARKTKDLRSFINSDYKFSKPKNLSETRKKRVMLVADGIKMFDEIFDFKKEELRKDSLKNNWFMGPFYVYDFNKK